MKQLLALIVPAFMLVQCNMHKTWSELFSMSTLITVVSAFIVITRASEFLCISFQLKDKQLEIMIAVITGYAIAKYFKTNDTLTVLTPQTPLRRVIVVQDPTVADEQHTSEEQASLVATVTTVTTEAAEDVYPPPESDSE